MQESDCIKTFKILARFVKRNLDINVLVTVNFAQVENLNLLSMNFSGPHIFRCRWQNHWLPAHLDWADSLAKSETLLDVNATILFDDALYLCILL